MKFIFLYFILSAFVFSCRDGQKCPTLFYLPAELTPVKTEYNVSDTITIASKFHREVLAFNTEGNELGFFNMAGVQWAPGTGIYRLDTLSGEDNLLLSEGISFIQDPNYSYSLFSTSTGQILTGEYNFENDSFDLQYKLVLEKPGLFIHEFGSFAGINDSQPFEGRCPGDFGVFIQVNEGMDNNISLLSESPNPHFNNWVLLNPKTRFYDMGGFAFKVVE